MLRASCHHIGAGIWEAFIFETACTSNMYTVAAASYASLVILAGCLRHFVTSASYQPCLFEQVYAPPPPPPPPLLHSTYLQAMAAIDRVVKRTEYRFLRIAAHTCCLAVVVRPLSFLSYLTDGQEQVCCVPPAQFHTMTCVCFMIPWVCSGQQVLRKTATCV